MRTRDDRLARLLALAHHIERLIEAGEVASYGEVGRRDLQRVLGEAEWQAQQERQVV